MSANERLDVDEFEASYADALCSIRKPLPIRVADVLLAVPRVIAAVRERDAEIARLKADRTALSEECSRLSSGWHDAEEQLNIALQKAEP